jgi:hypothetical protein
VGAEDELIALARGWAAANVKGDWAFLNDILADRYICTDYEGRVLSRLDIRDALASQKYQSSTFEVDDIKVFSYDDMAVVHGRSAVVGHYAGKDRSGQYRWTDVWIKRGGRWQCVATQSTEIPPR